MASFKDFWGHHITIKTNILKDAVSADLITMNRYFEHEYNIMYDYLKMNIKQLNNTIMDVSQLLLSIIKNEGAHQNWQFHMELSNIKKVSSEKLKFIFGEENTTYRNLQETVETTMVEVSEDFLDEQAVILKDLFRQLKVTQKSLKVAVEHSADLQSDKLAATIDSSREILKDVQEFNSEELLSTLESALKDLNFAPDNVHKTMLQTKRIRTTQLMKISKNINSVEGSCLQEITNMQSHIYRVLREAKLRIFSKIRSLYYIMFMEINNLQTQIDNIALGTLDVLDDEYTRIESTSDDNDDSNILTEPTQQTSKKYQLPEFYANQKPSTSSDPY